MRVETGPQVPGLILLASDFCHLVLNLVFVDLLPSIYSSCRKWPTADFRSIVSKLMALSIPPGKMTPSPSVRPPWKDGLQPLWFPLEGWLHLLQCSPWKDSSNFLSTPGRVSSNPLETIAFYRCSQIENSSANTTPPPQSRNSSGVEVTFLTQCSQESSM